MISDQIIEEGLAIAIENHMQFRDESHLLQRKTRGYESNSYGQK